MEGIKKSVICNHCSGIPLDGIISMQTSTFLHLHNFRIAHVQEEDAIQPCPLNICHGYAHHC